MQETPVDLNLALFFKLKFFLTRMADLVVYPNDTHGVYCWRMCN